MVLTTWLRDGVGVFVLFLDLFRGACLQNGRKNNDTTRFSVDREVGAGKEY